MKKEHRKKGSEGSEKGGGGLIICRMSFEAVELEEAEKVVTEYSSAN